MRWENRLVGQRNSRWEYSVCWWAEEVWMFVFVYLCICVFVYLCICVFVYLYICAYSSKWKPSCKWPRRWLTQGTARGWRSPLIALILMIASVTRWYWPQRLIISRAAGDWASFLGTHNKTYTGWGNTQGNTLMCFRSNNDETSCRSSPTQIHRSFPF